MDETDKVKIKEGSTEIFSEAGGVFYNPVQQFNRDISICVLNAYSKLYQNELSNKKSNKDDVVAGDILENRIGVKLEVRINLYQIYLLC